MASPDKNQIVSDVRSKYEEILKLNLEGRIFKEDLIKSWLDNILNDAKDYFINKYPDYDIFLFTQLIPKSITYRSNSSKIAVFLIRLTKLMRKALLNMLLILFIAY